MPLTPAELANFTQHLVADIMPTPLEIITSPGPRGSGRTYRMIMALPDRAVVVVPNAGEQEEVLNEICIHRGHVFAQGIIVYVIASEVGVAALATMRSPIFVDHSFWEHLNLSYRVGRRLEALLERRENDQHREEPNRTLVESSTAMRSALMRTAMYADTPLVRTVGVGVPVREPAISRTHRNPPRSRNRRGPETYTGPEPEDL